jgi:prophage regulatory protein
MTVQYLRREAVEERYDVPTSTLYSWMAAGKFPKPVKFGSGSVRWPAHELDAYDQARIAERGQAA